MISQAKLQGVSIMLVGVRMPPNFGMSYNNRFQQIFETVSSEQDVLYLPRFLEGVAASDPELMQSDGIHPTSKAQPILAEKVSAAMRQLLESG